MVFLSTIAAVCVVDQLVKLLVVSRVETGESFRVFPGLEVTHVRNTGAAFGLFAGKGQVLFWVAIGIVVLTLLWFFSSQGVSSAWYYAGVGLIVGGAAGNLVDRIARGTVVDYLDLGWWPVFNIADVAIVSGVIITAVLLVLDMRKEAGGHGEKKG